MAPKKTQTPKRPRDSSEDSEVSRQQSNGVVSEAAVFQGTVPFARITSEAEFDPTKHLKIVSWNVAGLRSLLKKQGELERLFTELKPDVLCLQETKLSPDGGVSAWSKLGVIDGYNFVDNVSVAKKGYSGTRTYVKTSDPRCDTFNFDVNDRNGRDSEGRIITTQTCGLAIVNTYVPNSGMMLERLEYREKHFDPMMRNFLIDLGKTCGANDSSCSGFIWTGDLNVAERDYDRFWGGNFKQMQKCPGFTPEERVSFRQTLSAADAVDAFRHLYPNASKVYSFWSARFGQRSKNNGWRLDYFVVSRSLVPRIVDCYMAPQFTASDHCPVVLHLLRK